MAAPLLWTFVISPWADGSTHDTERAKAIAKAYALGHKAGDAVDTSGVEFVSAIVRPDGTDTADVTYRIT